VCCTGIINAIPAVIAIVGLTDAESAQQASELCELARTFVIIDLLLFFYNVIIDVWPCVHLQSVQQSMAKRRGRDGKAGAGNR
jgi:hypothetical protein